MMNYVKFNKRAFYHFIKETWQEFGILYDFGPDIPALHEPQFNLILDGFFSKNIEVSKNDLQPWLYILELSIQWLSSLHKIIEEVKEKDVSKEYMVPWALTGAICSQSVSVRLLCLAGLDNSAKSVLRTMYEAINICLCTLFDPVIRKEFQSAQDFKEANIFWGKYFGRGKLEKRIQEIRLTLGFDEELNQVLGNWYKEEKTLLNQTIHTSYLAAALSCSVVSVNKKKFPLAVFGATSIFSIRTLSFACRSIWFFSLFINKMLFDPKSNFFSKWGSYISKDWRFINASSLFVLDKAILKYWSL